MDNVDKNKKRIFITGIVLLCFFIVFAIMLNFIDVIVNERNSLYDETVAELGATWGKEQTVAGPVLVVPYWETYTTEITETDNNGKTYKKKEKHTDYKYAMILPTVLNAKINVSDEIRNRGIYKATVYTTDMAMSGQFDIGTVESFFKNFASNRDITPNYGSAYFSFGMTDTSALTQVKKFYIIGAELKNKLSSGSGLKGLLQFDKGISVGTQLLRGNATSDLLKENAVIPFDIAMTFRGSNRLSFLPLGEESNITIDSTWNNPSFEGFAASSKDITEKGFTANWTVSKLNRDYPQAFTVGGDMGTELQSGSFGVRFYDGITHYRQVVRAVKYGYLFFALSFLVLFIFDVTSKNRTVHYVQYGVIGASLVMFYLLLLSVSEHIPFIPAYLVSAAAVVIPISLYIIAFMKDKRYGVAMFAILSGLYMILLSILKMENYALIMGTGLVMVTIYVLMYLTRNLRGEEKS